ncbi:nickel pincer cofactor-dependent isomerase, group 22 [Fusibacter ferrireducens]|uniref:DUF2088 domain-containing protein n=1 Tax=Fusibacter ferrireducens TaxID=2785058 RepID=A0ABR9ZU08_9FIRM|nr:DUF362 domain-containing protein [Fusibacter ferrireducens]MBF4693944.1 DUF2088 domain-containing protein [Fusibacter ferrireducens]
MLPKILLIRQNIATTPALTNPYAEAFNAMNSLKIDSDKIKDKTIGIAVGSRGLDQLPQLVKSIVDFVKANGGKPFIFAAIGTQGGGTSEGQAAMLASLGITEDTMEVPIRCCGESKYMGKTPSHGYDVYCNSIVDELEGLIVINRVKPHTDFTDITESGLLKIFAIGIGNPQGAQAIHTKALTEGHGKVIREIAAYMMAHLPVLFGVMTTENWKSQLDYVQAVLPENILETEKAALARVKENTIKLPVKALDALIVAEMGKNVSGTGMDTKTIGRIMILGQKEPDYPKIGRISVLGLTEATHGNYMGMGLADYTTMPVFRAMDIVDTSFNCVMASAPEQGRIPVIVENDRAAIAAAVETVGLDDPSRATLIYIRNTNCLEEMVVSEALYEQLKDNKNIEVLSELQEFEFDQDGRLLSFHKAFGL